MDNSAANLPQMRQGENQTHEIKAVDGRMLIRICYFRGTMCTFDTGFIDSGMKQADYVASLQSQIDTLEAQKSEIEE